MKFYFIIKKILSAPRLVDEEKNRIAGILHFTIIATVGGLTFLAFYRLVIAEFRIAVPLLATAFCLISFLTFTRKGLIELASRMFLWILMILLLYLSWTNDGFHDTCMYAVPGVLVMAGLLLKQRHFVTFSITTVLTVVLTGLLETSKVLQNAYSGHTSLFDIVDVAVILGITATAVRLFSENLIKTLNRARNDEAEFRNQADRLKASEERYRTLFEGAKDALLIMQEGFVVQCNMAALAMFGYTDKAEIVGRKFWEFSPPLQPDGASSREKAMNGIVAALGGTPQSFYWQHIRKDKTELDADVVLNRAVNGDQVFIQATIRDITEQKRAEEALRESEELYRILVTSVPDLIIRTNLDRNITFINEAVLPDWSLATKERLLGKNILTLVSPQDRDRAVRNSRLMLETQLGPREYAIEFENGASVDCEVNGDVLRGANGEPSGFVYVVRNISERKRGEESLRASEERFRSIYENSTLGLYRTSPDGTIILANPTLVKKLGYSSFEELAARNLEHEGFEPSYDRKHFIEEMEMFGEVKGLEAAWSRKDGSIIHIRESARAIHEADGRILYYDGSVEDITERKQAEEALRESESRFRQLAEAAVEGIAFTEKGIFIDGNARIATMLGYELQEMIGRPVADFIATESLSLVLGHLGENYEMPYEHFLKRKDGSTFPVESHARMMMWRGTAMRVTSLLDISERRRTQEQLHKLSLAVEQSPASIVITDTKGNIEYVNPKFTEVTGYTREEAIGKNPRILKSGVTPQDEYKRLWDSIASGKEWRGEFHNKKKNGELFWEAASISPVKNRDNVITNFVAVKEDITERKRAEDALRHAQKMESIGTLAGGIAHDFNNLLNAILGQSTLAIGKLTKESPAKNHIEKSIKAAEKAANLTKQLLAYSGKGQFVNEEIDFNRLVEENAQLLEVSVPKATELRYVLDSSPLYVHGDAGQIQQIIMNLIINAGEAMGPTPGTITLRTSRIQIEKNDAQFWKYTDTRLAPGTYVLLQVIDTGQGMRPEVLSRIFDPFFTTKFTGRGLGLAAVLGIIRAHKGGVRIESEVGKGTTFEIILPLVKRSVKIDVPMRSDATPINGNGKTVLVIDDELSVLELLSDVFNDANFKVLQTHNPIEGINLYRKHQREISIVILDYSMPDMDGKIAFEKLVKIDKGVRVLLCSGYSEDEMKSGFGDIRPLDFIKKPYKPAELLERVSSIVGKSE